MYVLIVDFSWFLGLATPSPGFIARNERTGPTIEVAFVLCCHPMGNNTPDIQDPIVGLYEITRQREASRWNMGHRQFTVVQIVSVASK
ncbi:hypothetical protein B0H19DRAFT_1248924 [Mycena capillaripes]|nr:hypothetical protein B0H19DRAFT_1248924 [Mycena capillaripes]